MGHGILDDQESVKYGLFTASNKFKLGFFYIFMPSGFHCKIGVFEGG